MDIPLRKGDGDIRLTELSIDFPVAVVKDGNQIVDFPDKSPQLEIKAVIAESQENRVGFRIFQDTTVFTGDFHQKFFRQIHIGSVSDADGKFKAKSVV